MENVEKLTLVEASKLLERKIAFIARVEWDGFYVFVDGEEYFVPMIWD
jgi:hypothetical protein